MKNKNEIKEFETVQFFREVKEKIANETKQMTFLEFKQYLSNRSLKSIR